MKKMCGVFLVIFLITGVALGGIPASQVPNQIAYQGLLTTTAGAPVTNGSYNIKFELYALPSGGSALWTETQSGVPVQNGTFSVYLGSLTPLPAIFNQPLYLQVTALAGPSISVSTTFPRTAFASVPYSLSLHLPFVGLGSQSGTNSILNIGNLGSGYAIMGSQDSLNGTNPGIIGQTNSVDGYALGLEGIALSTDPGGFSTGVRGISNGTFGDGIGVWGSQNGYGWGVYGYTPSGIGVYGFSSDGWGVEGFSETSYGLDAESYSSYGAYVHSVSNYGMYAVSDSSLAIEAYSPYAPAILSVSDSSVGVWGATGSYSGFGVLSWGPFAVSGSGDNSVILPDDAIDSYEILDEPGVSATANAGFFQITAATTVYRIDSTVITVPAPGKVLVQATGYILYNHTNGVEENLATNLDTTTTSVSNFFTAGVSSFTCSSVLPSFTDGRGSFANVRLFDAPAAGTYTFYLVAEEYSGNVSQTYVSFPYLSATYFPTAYGSTPVSITPSSSRGGELAADGGSVRVQTAAQFSAEKSAAMNRAINSLQSRLQSLETQMANAKATRSAAKQTASKHASGKQKAGRAN